MKTVNKHTQYGKAMKDVHVAEIYVEVKGMKEQGTVRERKLVMA